MQASSGDTTLAKERSRKLIEGKSARFRIRPEDGRFVQISAMDPKIEWPVPQTKETADPASAWSKSQGTPSKDGALEDRAARARYAHTIREDGKTWGSIPEESESRPGMRLAHANSRMSCYTCHSSWTTTALAVTFRCRPTAARRCLHNEGAVTRNYTNYNYQTLRDDLYMLGIDSTGKDHKIVPIRSACAVLVSSQDANRQWLYEQQQTVSAEGYAGTGVQSVLPAYGQGDGNQAVLRLPPLEEERQQCRPCTAPPAGNQFGELIGRFAWVGEADHGLEAVRCHRAR